MTSPTNKDRYKPLAPVHPPAAQMMGASSHHLPPPGGDDSKRLTAEEISAYESAFFDFSGEASRRIEQATLLRNPPVTSFDATSVRRHPRYKSSSTKKRSYDADEQMPVSEAAKRPSTSHRPTVRIWVDSYSTSIEGRLIGRVQSTHAHGAPTELRIHILNEHLPNKRPRQVNGKDARYPCTWGDCARSGTPAELQKHIELDHKAEVDELTGGDVSRPFTCKRAQCAGKQQVKWGGNLIRHFKDVHWKVEGTVWSCDFCTKRIRYSKQRTLMHLGVCLPRYMTRPDVLARKADASLKTPEERPVVIPLDNLPLGMVACSLKRYHAISSSLWNHTY